MTEKNTQRRVVRDPAFAKRLQIACENQALCPDVGRGQQKWIYEQLLANYKIRVSPEAVRKWFAGETRPRPNIMSFIARILEVDEAWLSLGIKPEVTPDERRVRNATATGAVNLLAGLIQLSGGHVAYPDGSDGPDLHMIMKGKAYDVDVALALDVPRGYKFTFNAAKRMMIGVLLGEAMRDFRLLLFSTDMVAAEGRLKGDFWEIVVEQSGDRFFAGERAFRRLRICAE